MALPTTSRPAGSLNKMYMKSCREMGLRPMQRIMEKWEDAVFGILNRSHGPEARVTVRIPAEHVHPGRSLVIYWHTFIRALYYANFHIVHALR